MKKIYLALLVQCFLLSKAYSQKVYTDQNQVFASKSFHFYGYDVSYLKYADTSRIGQDYKKFMNGFLELMYKRFNQKEYEINFKKGKSNVPFNPAPCWDKFEKTDFGNFVVRKCEITSTDSILGNIKDYKLNEKEGIGCIVAFNCFSRKEMTIDLTMIFFDISTRSMIYSKNIVSKDKNGYNYMADWKKGAIVAMERLFKATAKDFNEYQETHKKTKK